MSAGRPSIAAPGSGLVLVLAASLAVYTLVVAASAMSDVRAPSAGVSTAGVEQFPSPTSGGPTPRPSPDPTMPPASSPLVDRADIVISNIAIDRLSVDPITLAAIGAVDVTLTNRSTLPLTRTVSSQPVEVIVTAFVDTDSDRALTVGRDHLLGQGRTPPGESAEDILGPGMSASIAIEWPPEASLPFRDAPISVALEIVNAQELDPTDNVLDTASACMLAASSSDSGFAPTEEWRWPSGRAAISEPDSTRVSHPPLVADLDGDGWPEIVFVTRISGASGILRAVDGRDGSEVFTVSPSPDTDVHTISMPAIGDVDGDGRPEIVAIGPGDSVRALLIFGHDGTLQERIEDVIQVRPFETGENGPYLVDFEADGVPEIVVGGEILRADGSRPVDMERDELGHGGIVVADLQFDGVLDLISGPLAHAIVDGRVERTWTAQNPTDLERSTSRVAIGAFPAFSSGPHPLVVHVLSGGDANVLDASGRLVRSFSFPGSGGPPSARQGGPPLVADFDGDGEAEIAVAGQPFVVVYDVEAERPISVASETTEDSSFGRLGATAHDFDGDGAFEIVYAGERDLRIFAYSVGARSLQTIWSAGRLSETNQEYPTIADVDADGRAEIIAGSDFGRGGITVYSHPEWTGARRIWNQYDYHVDNIREDGAIPARARTGWREHGTFRASVPERGVRVAPDLTVSTLRLDGPDPTGIYSLTVLIGNAGGSMVGPDIPVEFEVDGNPLPGGQITLDRALGSGGSWRVAAPWRPGGDPLESRVRVVVNPEALGGDVAETLLPFRECRYDNNVLDVIVGDVAGPLAPTTATATPDGSTPSPTPTPTSTGPTARPPARAFLPLALAERCDRTTPALDLVIVLDLSAGMRRILDPPSAARDAFAALIDARSGLGDRFAGVAFAADVVDWVALDSSPDGLMAWLSALDAHGRPAPGTAIHVGLRRAQTILDAGTGTASGRRPTIVLISDGLEDRSSARESRRAADSIRAAGIDLVAAAFGPAADRPALIRLTGRATAVGDAGDVVALSERLPGLIATAACSPGWGAAGAGRSPSPSRGD